MKQKEESSEKRGAALNPGRILDAVDFLVYGALGAALLVAALALIGKLLIELRAWVLIAVYGVAVCGTLAAAVRDVQEG